MSSTISSPRGSALRVIAADIKLHHSVFALPFALLAAFMAALGPTAGTYFVSSGSGEDPMRGYAHPHLHPDYSSSFWPPFSKMLALIILAMILARTVAMLANRLLDRRIDALNPRTAGRAIPSGRLSVRAALIALLVCAAGFMFVCVAFGAMFENWWPTILGLPVLAWISAYPLLKRFTALCHIWLGASLAMSPLAAAIAIDPAAVTLQPALWLLGAMVLCWVAGFDIIYALQDVQIDREQQLHSIPSRLGVIRGLWVSRGLHLAAMACLLGMLLVDDRMRAMFSIGIALTGALLISEHATVARWGTTRIALAFFTLNGVISCVLGGLGIADVLIR